MPIRDFISFLSQYDPALKLEFRIRIDDDADVGNSTAVIDCIEKTEDALVITLMPKEYLLYQKGFEI